MLNDQSPSATALIAEIRQHTPGPWTAYAMVHEDTHQPMTPEQIGEYVCNSVKKSAAESGSNEFLIVQCEKADGPADICHVGNGPTSPANARLIASAPDLYAEVFQLRARLDLVEQEKAEKQAQLIGALNETTKLLDDERRRWYRALSYFGDLEGLAPEIVGKHIESRCQVLEQEKTILIALIASDLRVDAWDPLLVNWLKTPEDAARAMTLNMAKSRDELKHQNRALTARVEALEAQLKEECVCAAIRLPNGTVYRGHRHSDALQTAFATDLPRREIHNAEQGFITTRNRYVNRYEGMRLQREAGKSSAQHGELRGDMLFSEDLYLIGKDAALTPPTPKEPA